MTMRAFTATQPGDPLTLQWTPVPTPEPGPGELRVRLAAVTVNPVDFKLLRGGHPAWTYPHVPGVDGAGTVEAVGPGVETLRPGDRVAMHVDLTRPGVFAEAVVTSAHTVARVPDGVPLTVAAALPCAGMTAYQSLDRRLGVRPGLWRPGDWVLVNGASGGVGGYATQLARRAGARVIGVASAANHGYLRRLGAEVTLDYRAGDLAAQVREVTGGAGVPAVVETAGQATALLDAVAFGGGMACVLGLPDLPTYRAHPAKISVHPIALGAAHASGDRRAQEDLGVMLGDLLALVLNGELDPLVTDVREREALPATLAELAAGGVRGKLVVRMSGED
ncbi:zinc-binding dehydrogenase [Deinococcus kurensis]|uniref:zinc-binding dehydrogenase n=1 Tax=Deinococcus kurensis TaxID=2662757 RepID=UPI0012D3152F|nr:zinc-binding dehydrogenase [Deinococcus kurensis]